MNLLLLYNWIGFLVNLVAVIFNILFLGVFKLVISEIYFPILSTLLLGGIVFAWCVCKLHLNKNTFFGSLQFSPSFGGGGSLFLFHFIMSILIEVTFTSPGPTACDIFSCLMEFSHWTCVKKLNLIKDSKIWFILFSNIFPQVKAI